MPSIGAIIDNTLERTFMLGMIVFMFLVIAVFGFMALEMAGADVFRECPAIPS